MIDDAARRLSEASMAAYRGLVYETPGFVDYFFSATPIREIAELNIGSRPASRKATRAIEGQEQGEVLAELGYQAQEIVIRHASLTFRHSSIGGDRSNPAVWFTPR
jgi:hypothetical protein